MRTFDEILAIVAERKGDLGALMGAHGTPKSAAEVAAIPDDRWLAEITKRVFQAGFNWKVVDNMWPGFEEVFFGFDTGRCEMLNDDDLARLVSDKRIVRNGQKIRAVQQNAAFINELAAAHGSAGAFFAGWPTEDYVGLLAVLKKRGARLGGASGQYVLRFSGVDSFILSKDVTARLIAEGVVDKAPTSAKAMDAVQDAFNEWRRQSGRSLTEISRALAFSIG